MKSIGQQADEILHYIFYHVVNHTNEQGQTLHFDMLVDEFHQRIANRTLAEKVPAVKPYIEEYEKLILKEAAWILTREYRLYDTDLVEKLYKDKNL